MGVNSMKCLVWDANTDDPLVVRVNNVFEEDGLELAVVTVKKEEWFAPG